MLLLMALILAMNRLTRTLIVVPATIVGDCKKRIIKLERVPRIIGIRMDS